LRFSPKLTEIMPPVYQTHGGDTKDIARNRSVFDNPNSQPDQADSFDRGQSA
jgi:hypothetical protein